MSKNLSQEELYRDFFRAAECADWCQIVENGGPPCFHLDGDGKFCFRAARWAGHENGTIHHFKSLATAIEELVSRFGVREETMKASTTRAQLTFQEIQYLLGQITGLGNDCVRGSVRLSAHQKLVDALEGLEP